MQAQVYFCDGKSGRWGQNLRAMGIQEHTVVCCFLDAVAVWIWKGRGQDGRLPVISKGESAECVCVFVLIFVCVFTCMCVHIVSVCM